MHELDISILGLLVSDDPIIATASVSAVILGEVLSLERGSVDLAVVDLIAQKRPHVGQLPDTRDRVFVIFPSHMGDARVYASDAHIQLAGSTYSLETNEKVLYWFLDVISSVNKQQDITAVRS